MAKSKTYKFIGKTAYPKVYEPDEFRGSKKWKVPLYPDDETLQRIKDAGIQLKVKDDSGEKSGVSGKYVTFSRGTTVNFGSGPEDMAPPIIRDKDGEILVGYDDAFEPTGDPVIIGNGSEVELLVEVYETKNFGNGQRILEVKILDLIEYNPDNDDPDEEEVKPQEAPKEQKPKRKW